MSEEVIVVAIACLNAMKRCCADIPTVDPNLSDRADDIARLLVPYGYGVGDSYAANVSNRISSAHLFNISREMLIRTKANKVLSGTLNTIVDIIINAKIITYEPDVEPDA